MEKLEKEEGLRMKAGFYDIPVQEETATMREIRQLAGQIRDKRSIMKQESALVKNSSKSQLPRTSGAAVRGRSATKLRSEMENLGVDMSGTEDVDNFFIFYFNYNFSNNQ